MAAARANKANVGKKKIEKSLHTYVIEGTHLQTCALFPQLARKREIRKYIGIRQKLFVFWILQIIAK